MNKKEAKEMADNALLESEYKGIQDAISRLAEKGNYDLVHKPYPTQITLDMLKKENFEVKTMEDSEGFYTGIRIYWN